MKSVIYSWLVIFLTTCACHAANTHRCSIPEKVIVKSWFQKMAELEMGDTKPLKYMQMDVNFDGEQEVIVLGRGGYGGFQAMLVFKPSADSLICINELTDGFFNVGYAPGGYVFSTYHRSDGTDIEEFSTDVYRIVDGKTVMTGSCYVTARLNEEESEESYECSINDQSVSYEKYCLIVPTPKIWLTELVDNSKRWKSFTVSTAAPKL